VTTATPIGRPRLAIFDTSHLAGLAADWASAISDRRRTAQMFVPRLAEHGWLPLLCWHQVEELLQHQNDELVDTRLRYLRSWPLTAWIRSSDPNAGPGSILDVLKAEVAAANDHPEATAFQVRDLARNDLLSFGPATEALPNLLWNWRPLRAALTARQEKTRKVAAISRWRSTNIDNTRISDWIDKPVRESGDVTRALQTLRSNLVNEIATRGDKRIADPIRVADEFISEVARDGQAITGRTDLPPAIQILVNAGLQPGEIDPSSTLAEAMELLAFHKRLDIVAKTGGPPLRELKRTVARRHIPVVIIEEGMRKHAHDQPERKGSDLNDVHLLCIAPYADITFVDKRTLEGVRRAKARDAIFSDLVGQVSKASRYSDIFGKLTEL